MRKLVLVVFSLMAMSISAMNPVEGQENEKLLRQIQKTLNRTGLSV